MKQASLAILLKPKGGKPAGDDADEEETEGELEDEHEDYKALAEEAFPDEEWTPERVAALKELVMACMEKE